MMTRKRLSRFLAAVTATSVMLGTATSLPPQASAASEWMDMLKPLVKEVIVPGVSKGAKIWMDQRRNNNDESTPGEAPPNWDDSSTSTTWTDASTPTWSDESSSTSGWSANGEVPPPPPEETTGWEEAPAPESSAPVWQESRNPDENMLSLASTDSDSPVQTQATYYTIDQANKLVSIRPGGDASTTINNALSYLIKRSDKSTPWTVKFAGGQYNINRHMFAEGLQNVHFISDPANPAVIAKSSSFADEYLFFGKYTSKITMRGFKFYGKTNFKSSLAPVWTDQGVYFGSSKDIVVENNRFYNFGNAAFRVTTHQTDPTTGINSFNTRCANNYFENVYQTSTTSNTKVHGATTNYVFENNEFVNLRGSVKFASRTPGAKNLTIRNNIIRNSSLDGFEISSYNDVDFSNNKIYNIARHGLNAYPNDRSGTGFAWGNNYRLVGNTVDKARWGFRIAFDQYDDGTKYVPQNFLVDGNTLSNITEPGVAAVNIGNGAVNNLDVIRNKLNNISSKQYFNIHKSSTAVTVAGNYVNGVAYGTPLSGSTPTSPSPSPSPTPTTGTLVTPVNLAAQAGTYNSKPAARLTWVDKSGNETGQELWISTDAKNYKLLTRIGANVTSYTHSIGTSPTAATYYYKARAYNSNGYTSFGNQAQIATKVSGTVIQEPVAEQPAPSPTPTTGTLVTPTNLAAQAGTYNSQPAAKLTWVDKSGNETGQELWISTDAKNYKLLTRIGANVTTYTHTIGTSPSAATYYYKARAYNSSGYTSFGNQAQVATKVSSAAIEDPVVEEPTPEPTPTAGKPATPANLAAKAGNLNSQPAARLTWIDKAGNESGQEVWISTDAKNYKLLSRVKANATEYIHTIGTAPSAATYYYKVRAYNDTGFSSFGNQADIETGNTTASLP